MRIYVSPENLAPFYPCVDARSYCPYTFGKQTTLYRLIKALVKRGLESNDRNNDLVNAFWLLDHVVPKDLLTKALLAHPGVSALSFSETGDIKAYWTMSQAHRRGIDWKDHKADWALFLNEYIYRAPKKHE